jgi:hypothetical protein
MSQLLQLITQCGTSSHSRPLCNPSSHGGTYLPLANAPCPTCRACAHTAHTQGYGAAAAREGEDVIGITISVVEEESDPRCLLLAFECVQVGVGMHTANTAKPIPELLELLE